MSRSCRALGIFAKYWDPGAVKTRLATVVGPDHAARFHQLSLRSLIVHLSRATSDRILCYSPPHKVAAFRRLLMTLRDRPDRDMSAAIVNGVDGQEPEGALPRGWSLHPQRSGDLGERMQGWFEDCFRSGYQHVILLGSDAPTVPLSIIEQAWESLQRAPVVLAPSEDGGYYLVGVSATAAPDWRQIFVEMPWSTSQVFEQTIRCLSLRGIQFTQLEAWYDVDEWADLPRLWKDLDAAGDSTDLLSFVGRLLAEYGH